jgi:putative transposase
MPHHSRSCLLRSGRYSEIGRIYLVTSIVHDRQPVFAEWTLARLLVNEFRRAEQQGLVQSLAWVVMPDHFHWLFELKSGTLAGLMKQVKASSSRAINRGRLWQQGYHDKAVRREEDIRELARYIVANPLRAALVKRVGDYPLWDAVWI